MSQERPALSLHPRDLRTIARDAVIALLGAAGLVIIAPAAIADELGLNIFGLSLHTDRPRSYNAFNAGLGLHYVFSHPAPRWELFLDGGTYYDSDRNWAKYAAVGTHYRWAESWKVGIAAGYAQSRSYNSGDPFFAPVPSLAYDYRRIVLNAVLLPSESSNSKVAGFAFFVTVPIKGGD